MISPLEKDKSEDELPYLLALKVELNLKGRESLKFGIANNRPMKQCSYMDTIENLVEKHGEVIDNECVPQAEAESNEANKEPTVGEKQLVLEIKNLG